jgi:hypothetical protein
VSRLSPGTHRLTPFQGPAVAKRAVDVLNPFFLTLLRAGPALHSTSNATDLVVHQQRGGSYA